jgi:SAM-dependent methyltransferase
MQIDFHHFQEFQGRAERFPAFIEDFIKTARVKSVWEIGAGANPALSRQFVESHGIDYTVSDVAATELEKAAYRPRMVVVDMSRSADLPCECVDLVFSRMSLEHVPDVAMAHRNIWRMLKPGGLSVHCFPTMFALPFLINRVVSERFSRFLLDSLVPRGDYYMHDKFPAKYDLCRGPMTSQIRRMENLGFEIVQYSGFYGHNYYRNAGLKLLHWLEEEKAKQLLRWRNPLFTAYATVVLKKRGSLRDLESMGHAA